MRIFRIRRHSGRKGGSKCYYHADVIASNKESALRAAKEGRVYNWRWIDTFDTASKDYCEYEILYPLSPNEAEKPKRPLTKQQLREHKAKLEVIRIKILSKKRPP